MSAAEACNMHPPLPPLPPPPSLASVLHCPTLATWCPARPVTPLPVWPWPPACSCHAPLFSPGFRPRALPARTLPATHSICPAPGPCPFQSAVLRRHKQDGHKAADSGGVGCRAVGGRRAGSAAVPAMSKCRRDGRRAVLPYAGSYAASRCLAPQCLISGGSPSDPRGQLPGGAQLVPGGRGGGDLGASAGAGGGVGGGEALGGWGWGFCSGLR
jgi:hypothetical protein